MKRIYETPTGSLISENDYNYLSAEQKKQCKDFIAFDFNPAFDNLICSINRMSNTPIEEHPISKLSSLKQGEITNDFTYIIEHGK